MSAEQLSLFPGDPPQAVTPDPGLTPNSSLDAAMERFRDHMIHQEYAENTVKSFLGDLRILKRYLEGDPPIGQISTKNLQDYLHWLQYERGKPCSPKSYARRLTTLKVFFAWLAAAGVLPADPAAALVHKPVQTPLPRILYDDQVDEVLAVTRQMMAGELPAGLSFEMLRWTCAVRDHQARMDPDRLRRKLGLSQMSWQETEPKLVRLAEPPL